MRYLAVFIGGAVGSLARWGTAVWLGPHGEAFPLATFVANLVGAFGLGLVGVLLTERWIGHPHLRPLVGVGFFGAYTTFSIMAVEGVLLVEAGRVALALSYWLATLVAGQSAALLGLLLGLLLGRTRRLRA